MKRKIAFTKTSGYLMIRKGFQCIIQPALRLLFEDMASAGNLKLILLFVAGLLCAGQSLNSQPITDLMQAADSCMHWAKTGRLPEADSLCEHALRLADASADVFAKANIYRVAGNMALEKHDYVTADARFSKALTIAEKLKTDKGKDLKANTIFDYALMFYKQSDFEKALESCFDARKLAEENGNIKLLAQIDNRIGGIYIVLNQSDKASTYNKRAYLEAMQTGDKELLSTVLIAYGNFMLHKQDTTEAIRLFNEAFDYAKSLGLPHNMSTAAYDIAYAYLEMGDYNKALEYSRIAYKWGKAGKIPFDECDALYKIGLSYYYLEAFEIARDTLSLALEMAKTINSKALQHMIYDALNCLEASDDNFEKAYDYFVYFYELSQEILSENDQQQMNFLEAKYKDARKQAEIDRLKHRVEKGATMIVILLLLLVLFFVYYRYRQRLSKAYRQAKEQEISKLEQEKQLVATQALLKGETTERVRLSKDLHDGIGGMLSATKLKIANMKGNLTIPGEHVETFNTALTMLDNSIRELRRVAHNLMPESLMKYGLNPALQDFCNSLEKVQYHFYGSDRRLDEKFETSVYRIVQELVTNAVKHSGAELINVQLIVEEDRVSIVVQDNGKGFDAKAVQHSKSGGLQNIRFRVSSFNGHLDISSKPGTGTEINIEFNC